MNDYDAVEELRLIVWAVIAQDESIDDPDGLADLIVDAIIANGWPRP